MIDTHCHLNFKAFESNWNDVISRAQQAGVRAFIIVGTDYPTSLKAIEIAECTPGAYAAVGIHPHHAQSITTVSDLKAALVQIEPLIQKPKVVAIGEVGLDYHHYQETKHKPLETNAAWQNFKQIQLELFSCQILFAQKYDKPLIMHSREAGEDVLNQLSHNQVPNNLLQGVFHCFDGSKKYAKKIIEAGFFISFTGNVTYVPDRMEVAIGVPMDRLLLETDSPYMSPYPLRNQVNEPANILNIAQAHARSRNTSVVEIIEKTTLNAVNLFKLKLPN